MRRMIHNRITSVAAMLLMLVPVTLQQGCGNGFFAGLTLSNSTLMPGQFVKIFHPEIEAGTTVKVRFEGPGGFEVEADTVLTDDGAAAIAVPPVIDMQTGAIAAGQLQVSLPDFSGDTVTLAVTELPEINAPSPGALLREVLLASLEVADDAESKAAGIALDLPDAVESSSDLEFFTQQRAAVTAILDELDTTGQLTVETAGGAAVTLTADDLALGDRILAGYLVGIIDETGGDSSVALKSGPRLQGSDGSILDFEALKEEFRRAANNIVNGGGAFVGSLTLIVAGGGLLLSGAGEVAAVGGLVLTAGGALWALGSSSILNRIGSFFDDKLGDLFNEGRQALDGAIAVGASALGTLQGKLGQLFSGVSTLLTAQSTYENFTNLECQTNPPPSGQKRSFAHFQTGSFCVVVLPGLDLACSDDCFFSQDGVCDDGGEGSEFNLCDFGTDCADCGARSGTADGGDAPIDGGGDGGTTTTGFRIWRVTNYGSAEGGYITVASESADQNPPLLSSFPGGGISPEVRAELSPVTDVFSTSDAAVDSVCSSVSGFFRPPLASFILMATFDGQVVGIDGVFQSRCGG